MEAYWTTSTMAFTSALSRLSECRLAPVNFGFTVRVALMVADVTSLSDHIVTFTKSQRVFRFSLIS